MAHRLLQISERPFDRAVETIGLRMLDCALNERGFRCGHSLCPRCAARVAKKNRRRLEALVAALPSRASFAFATFTAPHDSLIDGQDTIQRAFKDLRRRSCWQRAVLGGYGQIEVIPTLSGDRHWLLHIHALVHLAPGLRADAKAINNSWRDTVGFGRVDWRPVRRERTRGIGRDLSKVCFYVTKRKRAADYLGVSPVDLRELAARVGTRRWVLRFGTCYRFGRSLARRHPSESAPTP